MFKITRTASMTICTIKAFGFFANVSFGRSKQAKAPRVVWTHSYEQACAASDYALRVTAAEFGYSRVNLCEASQRMYRAAHKEYLARQPKLTKMVLA